MVQLYDIGHRLGSGDGVTFQISDVDDGASVRYYGYLATNGAWMIVKEDRSVDPTTYRYISGKRDYVTNWTGRAALSYDYYHVLFEGALP